MTTIPRHLSRQQIDALAEAMYEVAESASLDVEISDETAVRDLQLIVDKLESIPRLALATQQAVERTLSRTERAPRVHELGLAIEVQESVRSLWRRSDHAGLDLVALLQHAGVREHPEQRGNLELRLRKRGLPELHAWARRTGPSTVAVFHLRALGIYR